MTFSRIAILFLATLVCADARAQQLECVEPPPPPETEPASPDEFRAKIENSRLRYLYFACMARRSNAERAQARARAGQGGRLEDFLADGTLQKGDVIVTDRGFRVFRGADAPKERDFKPVEEGAAPRLRRRLDDMERASRKQER